MNNSDIQSINSCRICAFKQLKSIFSLGEFYVSDFVGDRREEGAKYPLELALCNKPDGQPRRSLDTGRAEKEFGFRAKASFKEGLKSTINWYRNSLRA